MRVLRKINSIGSMTLVTVKSEKLVLDGARFRVHQMEVEGNDGQTYWREVIRHPGAVVLLPLLDEDHVVLIENYRMTIQQTLLELPAGTREPNEPSVETARRELIEETGYTAETLEPLHEFFSAPGICDEWMEIFVAKGLTLGDANREAVEQISNRIASRAEIAELLHSGQIRDAKSLVGLYAFLYSPKLNSQSSD